jgi:hypothetical protein
MGKNVVESAVKDFAVESIVSLEKPLQPER